MDTPKQQLMVIILAEDICFFNGEACILRD